MSNKDRDRVRELFDLRGAFLVQLGGGYEDDPYQTRTERTIPMVVLTPSAARS